MLINIVEPTSHKLKFLRTLATQQFQQKLIQTKVNQAFLYVEFRGMLGRVGGCRFSSVLSSRFFFFFIFIFISFIYFFGGGGAKDVDTWFVFGFFFQFVIHFLESLFSYLFIWLKITHYLVVWLNPRESETTYMYLIFIKKTYI